MPDAISMFSGVNFGFLKPIFSILGVAAIVVIFLGIIGFAGFMYLRNNRKIILWKIVNSNLEKYLQFNGHFERISRSGDDMWLVGKKGLKWILGKPVFEIANQEKTRFKGEFHFILNPNGTLSNIRWASVNQTVYPDFADSDPLFHHLTTGKKLRESYKKTDRWAGLIQSLPIVVIVLVLIIGAVLVLPKLTDIVKEVRSTQSTVNEACIRLIDALENPKIQGSGVVPAGNKQTGQVLT